jgi:hypothetical protein
MSGDRSLEAVLGQRNYSLLSQHSRAYYMYLASQPDGPHGDSYEGASGPHLGTKIFSILTAATSTEFTAYLVAQIRNVGTQARILLNGLAPLDATIILTSFLASFFIWSYESYLSKQRY